MVTTIEVRAVTVHGQYVRRVDRYEGLIFTSSGVGAEEHARVFASLEIAKALCSVWDAGLSYTTKPKPAIPLSGYEKRQRDSHTQSTFPMMELEETRSS